MKRGTNYSEVCDFLAVLIKDPEFEGDAAMYVDTSGVGRAVGTMLDERRVPFMAVQITSGDSFREVDYRSFRVSKTYLISHLTAALGEGSLFLNPQVLDAIELRRQFEDMQATVLDSGVLRVEASGGSHDDLVLATAIGVFGATHARRGGFSATPVTWG